MSNKILFISAGPIEWGSSRMRVYWVAEAVRERGHDVNVEMFDTVADSPYPLLNPDVYIWQKLVNLDIVKATPNARHYWDVCDPAWWWQPAQCREIADLMTGVVASSMALAEDYNKWHRREMAYCIPDRLKLSHFHTQRKHQDVSPVRLIWFGVAVNRIALYGALANLERLVANGYKIELTVFDNRPDIRLDFTDAFPIYHVQWSLMNEVDVLSSHDVAILPPYPGAWGKVKSNNRTLTAWACGLPVVTGFDYDDLLQHMNRWYRGGVTRAGSLPRGFAVEESAVEWENVLK